MKVERAPQLSRFCPAVLTVDNIFPDVEITTCKGKEVCVKAAKGVVMACGGNICEAFTSGMMCGQNVSALEAWG